MLPYNHDCIYRPVFIYKICTSVLHCIISNPYIYYIYILWEALIMIAFFPITNSLYSEYHLITIIKCYLPLLKVVSTPGNSGRGRRLKSAAFANSNFVSAFCNSIVVIVAISSLVEPDWFTFNGSTCRKLVQ